MRTVRTTGLILLVLAALPPLAGAVRRDAASQGALGGPPVRVLLLEGPAITVGAAGRGGVRLRDAQDRPILQIDPGRQLRVRRLEGALSLEPLPMPARRDEIAAEPPPAQRLPLQSLRLEPIDPQGLLVLKQRRYRGELMVRPEAETLQAINRLPLETYLLGVVGSEMPMSWPQAALRAQAVASRTYALRQLNPKAPFDLRATVVSQVYKGVEGESEPTREAVLSTKAKVLMHGDRLINAVFHSSSGGRTEDSGALWQRQMPYLVSVPDFDLASPVSRWEKAFPPDALRQAFQEIGGALTIQPLETSKSGRLRRVKVIGPAGELELSGSEIRDRLGLRSTLVVFQFEPADRVETPVSSDSLESAGGRQERPTPLRPASVASGERVAAATAPPPADGQPSPTNRLVVKGRGFGHGVGMSQWGAYSLALRGNTYEDILRHYYRGAVVRSYGSR